MQQGEGIRRYGPDAVASAAFALTSRAGSDVTCDETGETAMFQADTRGTKELYQFDWRTGSQRQLFHAPTTHPVPIATASPDGRYVAYAPGTVDPNTAKAGDGVQLIPVAGAAVRWSEDSSIVLSVTLERKTPETMRNALELVYVRTGRRIVGRLPSDYMLQDTRHNAVFLDGGKRLRVWLTRDESKPDGAMFDCELPSFQCRAKPMSAGGVAMTERGDIAFSQPGKVVSGTATSMGPPASIQVIRPNAEAFTLARFVGGT